MKSMKAMKATAVASVKDAAIMTSLGFVWIRRCFTSYVLLISYFGSIYFVFRFNKLLGILQIVEI